MGADQLMNNRFIRPLRPNGSFVTRESGAIEGPGGPGPVLTGTVCVPAGAAVAATQAQEELLKPRDLVIL